MFKYCVSIAVLVFSFSGGAIAGGAAESDNIMTIAEARVFLNDLFGEFFDPNNDPETTVSRYMTPDYIQLVDGETIDYAGFVDHLKVLLETLESADFTFKDIVVSGNTIADIHIVDAVKKDGSKIKAKVIAFYYLRDDKMITKVDELTYMLEGSEEDRDLGSRQSH